MNPPIYCVVPFLIEVIFVDDGSTDGSTRSAEDVMPDHRELPHEGEQQAS